MCELALKQDLDALSDVPIHLRTDKWCKLAIEQNDNPNKPWCFPTIIWENIRDNLDKLRSWCCVYPKNANITWEIIRDNPDVPWDWSGISQN